MQESVTILEHHHLRKGAPSMISEKYIGLDVHQATISVAVLDSTGKLIMESILETKASGCRSCGSPKLDRPDHIDFSTAWKEQSGNMLVILLGLFQLIWLFGRGHHAVVLENLALRQQLSIYKRKKKRPRLVGRERWFWIALSAVWEDWRRPLFVVHPDTVVRWQRERFRRYWAHRSKKSGRRGRPPISRQVRKLIRTIACANPLWRAPRIHGELQKLGIEVSERTVSRVLRTVKRPPSQTWKTFFQNHIGETAAIA